MNDAKLLRKTGTCDVHLAEEPCSQCDPYVWGGKRARTKAEMAKKVKDQLTERLDAEGLGAVRDERLGEEYVIYLEVKVAQKPNR